MSVPTYPQPIYRPLGIGILQNYKINFGKGNIIGGGGKMKFIGNRVLMDVPLVFGIYGGYLKDNEFISFKKIGCDQGHGIAVLGDKSVCEGNKVVAYAGIENELCYFESNFNAKAIS